MSEEQIFQQKIVKASDNLMSFAGCPNRCRDGYYIDPYKHKRIRCEYCLELRRKLVKEDIKTDSGAGVAKALRLPQTLMGYGNFDVESVFVKAETTKMEDWSVQFVSDVLKGMMERVSVGEAVASSLLINLGRRAHTQHFISPFLIRSYISGLTTAPFLTSLDVACLRLMQSGDLQAGWRETYKDMSMESIIKADTCLVYIDAGAGSNHERELNAVKGLMQLRAWEGRGTIILTDYYSKKFMFDSMTVDANMAEVADVATNTSRQSFDAVRGMLDGSASPVRDLALYVGVKYKDNAVMPPDNRRGSQGTTAGAVKNLFSQNSSVGVS